jgi:hypothetical protein
MPIVLKHNETSQIYTCNLLNSYRLEYYGTKFWDDWDKAKEQVESFLQMMGDEPKDWELIEIEESKMKIFNVRLKNDPNNELLLDESGRPFIKRSE